MYKRVKVRRRLYEADFSRIKTLLQEGLSADDVARVTDRSYSTVYIMSHCASYGDYRQFLAARQQVIGQKTIRPAAVMPNGKAAKVKTNSLDQSFEELDKLFEQLKEVTAEVIEEAVKTRVDTEMAKVAVELRELRLLRDQAKNSNWLSALKGRLAG